MLMYLASTECRYCVLRMVSPNEGCRVADHGPGKRILLLEYVPIKKRSVQGRIGVDCAGVGRRNNAHHNRIALGYRIGIPVRKISLGDLPLLDLLMPGVRR